MNHKNRLIEEIKKIKKEEIFKKEEKKKIGILKRLSIIFGYGKKR